MSGGGHARQGLLFLRPTAWVLRQLKRAERDVGAGLGDVQLLAVFGEGDPEAAVPCFDVRVVDTVRVGNVPAAPDAAFPVDFGNAHAAAGDKAPVGLQEGVGVVKEVHPPFVEGNRRLGLCL